jgi:hypothetical protein
MRSGISLITIENNDIAPVELVRISPTTITCCDEDVPSNSEGGIPLDFQHNDLEGLQGGSTYERYHLTREQYLNAIAPSAQEVNIIAGEGIQISGTYPNLVITATKTDLPFKLINSQYYNGVNGQYVITAPEIIGADLTFFIAHRGSGTILRGSALDPTDISVQVNVDTGVIIFKQPFSTGETVWFEYVLKENLPPSQDTQWQDNNSWDDSTIWSE